MDSIWIKGGNKLEGDIPISGAKNAALTLLPCALLTEEKLTLGNLPRLADVDTFGHLLNQLGVSTSVAGVKKGEFGRRMTLQASDIASTVAPYDMVRRMRASILVLGPMLALLDARHAGRDTELIEQVPERIDVGEARQVAERQFLFGKKRAGQQSQRGVLGAGNGNIALELFPALDPDAVHRRALALRGGLASSRGNQAFSSVHCSGC
jgi:hypothetical protein